MAASSQTVKSTRSLELLFKSLNLLISPQNSKLPVSEDASEELLHCVLQNNLADFQQLVRDSPELQNELGDYSSMLLQDLGKSFLDGNIVPVRQKFTEVCMCLLHFIIYNLIRIVSESSDNTATVRADVSDLSENSDRKKDAIPELPPDTLSIQQEKTITTSLQFLVVLGICPYLVPGAGIPISQRLGPGRILLATAYDYSTEMSDLSRVQHLAPVIKLLCSMLQVPSLKDIVLNNCLTDLLAALLQARHCAKVIMQKKLKEAKNDISGISECFGPCLNNVELDLKGSSNQKIMQQSQIKNQLGDKPKQADCSSLDSGDMKLYMQQELLDMYCDVSGQLWTLASLADYCSVEIDRSIRLSTVPHVLTCLMLLLGSSKPQTGSLVTTPIWFRRTVASILRDIIMIPPGIQHLLTVFIGDYKDNAQDWQKCKAVAQIISRCPVTPNNVKQFCTSVSRQLIELLQPSETKTSPCIVRTVGEAILELTNQHPELMQEVCLSHLLAPLKKLSSENVKGLNWKDGQVVASEQIVTHCITCLYRLFVLGQEPQSSLVSSLHEVIGILFSVYVSVRKSVSVLRSFSCDLIKAYLSHCDSGQAVKCLMSLALSGSSDDATEYPAVDCNVALQCGPEGGVQAVFVNDKLWSIDSWTEPVDGIVDVMSNLHSDSVTADFFLCLLQRLTDVVSSESTHTDVVLPARVLSSIQQTERLSELREKVVLVSLVAAVGEKFGEQVIQCGHHVLTFVKATLERSVKICQSSHDDATLSFEWETASMALGLLTAILSGAVELTDADKKLLDDLLPLLTAVSGSDVVDESVKEMAEDLKVAVATRGLVWTEISKIRSRKKGKDKQKQNFEKPGHVQPAKPLIEVLSETSDTDEPADSAQAPKHSIGGATKQSGVGGKFEEALQDLCDPLLPVKGHGLISLARLIEDRDHEVKGKQEMLLKIFMENLTHTDSYIYLAAVNGLSSLSDLCPDEVVPCLTSEFRSKCIKNHSSRPVETILKVGESLVKATRRLGEMAPKYRDLVLPAVLCGCRHEDALVRASSLSGLAEVCRLLRFSVGTVIYEVINCCRDIMKSDPDPEPRKAAAMTLRLLLQGLGKDIIEALGDALLDLYRVLKHSHFMDPDEKVKLNANLALVELDNIMREALFAKPELKKTVTILGYQ